MSRLLSLLRLCDDLLGHDACMMFEVTTDVGSDR